MSDEVLSIEPHVSLQTIYIWEPRWRDSVCLVDKRKIRDHNRIVFTKAKSLRGKEFYISGAKAKKFKTESNGTIACRAIPMSELKLMKQERSW